MKADKLVVDTCVFIECLFGEEGNLSSYFLSNLDKFNARLIFSQDTIGELFYILKRECNNLQMSDDEISAILFDTAILFQESKSVNTRYYKYKRNKIKIEDEDDQMFVDAAFASNATHLITLDEKSGILNLKNVPFICCTPTTYLLLKDKIEA